jgi:hypothetical protein
MLRPSPDIVAGLLAWVAIVGMVFHFALPKSANFQTAFVKVEAGKRHALILKDSNNYRLW